MLTEEDFAVLQREGRRLLSTEIRTRLNSQILHHCGPAAERFDRRNSHKPLRKPKPEHERLSNLARDSDRLLEDFDKLKHAIYGYNALLGASPNPQERSVRAALKELGGAARVASNKRREFRRDYPNKSGRRSKVCAWLERFFLLAAEAYHEAGGCVSAGHQRDKGRNSPFVRFLLKLYSLLPEDRRTVNANALTEWSHRTGILYWKEFNRAHSASNSD